MSQIIPFVFLDVAVIVLAARLVGNLFARVGQPAVVGEIVAGIVLGPTVLGLFPGDLPKVLFPPDVRPYLNVIAQIGLVLFMFLVGLEVDLSLIRARRRVATTISLASIALPFGLGAGLALQLYDAHGVVDGKPVPPLAFALFLGIAMAITAFPVLARILTERNMHRTPTGVLALACAAVDDVVAWSLLAVVVAVAVGGTLSGFAAILGLTVLYALVMLLVVRPLLGRLVGAYRAHGRLTPDALAVVLAGLLLSACATEVIGVHAIFGAFVFGAIMPRDEPGLTRAVMERLEQVSVLLLLPVFFVIAGLQVDVRGLGLAGLGELAAILAVAIGGKFVGAAAAARLQRVPNRQAVALGLLMNTRGLTELVILQVGLQLGVLDVKLYTLMVLMALVTTVMTEPLLRRVYPDRIVQREIAAAERAELGDQVAAAAVVVVPPGAGPGLVRIAHALLGAERPARLVLCRFLHREGDPLELASGIGSDLVAVAAAGDELKRLAAGVRGGAGVKVSPVVRYSTDPDAALAELLRTVGAELVVMPEPDPAQAPGWTPPEVGEAALVLARPEDARPGPRVGVLADGDAAARAAVRLAGRLALGAGPGRAVLAVGTAGTQRHERRVTAELAKAGIATVPGLTDLDVLVAGATADPALLPAQARTVLRVHPSTADVDEDLQQVVARIGAPPAEPV